MPIRLTKSVKILLLAALFVFVIQQSVDLFFGFHLMSALALSPAGFFHMHRFWQLLTFSFLHFDVLSLFFDLLVLAMIGSELEANWGAVRFLKFYFFCATSAAVIFLIVHGVFGSSLSSVPLVGPSSAVYGLLVAYGLIYGERTLLFMMIFPLKAKHFIWILALLELLTTAFSSGGGYSALPQLSGMIFGFIYLWLAATVSIARKNGKWLKRGSKNSKKRKSSHLRLVVDNDPSLGPEDDEDGSGENPKTWH